MICIECTYPDVSCLFSKFKSNYIKLTICPNCGKVVDKYIEYDNVILFIDILLLKPQAYRHLAYNVAETELLKDEVTHSSFHSSSNSETNRGIEALVSRTRQSFARYKKLIRFITMTILFEVYLIWAYEERNATHTMALSYILEREVYLQYCFFIIKQTLEQSVFCTAVFILYRKWFDWGRTVNKNLHPNFQRTYSFVVLLITIFISSSIKTFPIIMLIWPYDKTSISATLIYTVGLLNTTEALHINTTSSYKLTLSIVASATIFQHLVSRLILGLGISYVSSSLSFKDILKDEMNALRAFKYIGDQLTSAF